MGVVYKARHRALNRLVALKMILAGEFASEAQRRWFRLEAELAARVQHPHVVQVYEVGVHEGRPFLALEWVEGGTLADRLDGTPWPPRAAAGLVAALARAIVVAHRQGVIHRDLKPANILLQSDGAAEPARPPESPDPGVYLSGHQPKIADFGLARPALGEGGLTATGFVVGTPEYMAPEQADGRGHPVGPGADLYALGAILYELLTGRSPFKGATALETLEQARSAEPVPPSRLVPGTPRDVETIGLKCLEKDPARRYESAAALAEDLRRYLAHEPIRARPASAHYKVRKFVSRHKELVAGTAVVFAALLAATLISLLSARDARQSARLARSQAYRARLAAAIAALSGNDVADAARHLERAPQELRGWEWRHLSGRLDDSSAVIRLQPGTPALLLPGPKGLRVGTFTGTGLRFTDERGDESPGRPSPRPISILSIASAADGWWLAAREGPTRLTLRDDAGRVLHEIEPVGGYVIHLALSPDRTRLAALLASKNDELSLVIYDPSSGKERARWPIDLHPTIHALALSPDGTRVACGGDDRVVPVWDTGTGRQVALCRGHKSKVHSIVFSGDGSRLLTASHDGTVRQWDARTGREVEPPYDRHTAEVFAAVYSPDGRRVASAGSDRTVRLWHAAGRQDQAVLRGHTGVVPGLAFSQDGRRLVSASYDLPIAPGDGTARFWEAAPEATLPVLAGHTSYVYPVAYSPDGRWIASGDWDKAIRVWDAATGEACATLPHPAPGIVRALAFTPDGTRLVSGGDLDGQLLLWDVATGHLRGRLASGKSVRSLAVSPDGTRVAAGFLNSNGTWTMSIAELATGRKLGAGEGIPFAFSPDGKWLACRDGGGKVVVLWDAHALRPVARWQGHAERINAIAFDREGGRLASASSDRTVRLWDAATGRCLRVFQGHTDEVFAAAFHPDGTRLASAGRDRAIWLWDPASDEALARLPGHKGYVWSLAFSPDGKTLASGSGDNDVRLWGTEPLRMRYEARRRAEALRPEAERLVERLLREEKGAAAVVAAVRADRSLGVPQKDAASRAVLRRAATGPPVNE
jgi:WD40 repeat protein